MRHLKKFNEVLRTKGMSREEESELEFQEAYEKGLGNPNLMYLGESWERVSSKYLLYGSYYLYKDYIFILKRPTDYSWRLERVKEEPHVFKQKIFDKIKNLEEAFNKL